MDPTRIQHEVTPGKRVFPMMHPTPRRTLCSKDEHLRQSYIGASVPRIRRRRLSRHGPAQRLATPPRPAAPWLQGNGCRPRAAFGPWPPLSCRARTCARPECRLPQRLCAPDMPRALREFPTTILPARRRARLRKHAGVVLRPNGRDFHARASHQARHGVVRHLRHLHCRPSRLRSRTIPTRPSPD